MIDDAVIELQPNIFLIHGDKGGSHSYLIRGDYKNILIDSGLDKNFHKLQRLFTLQDILPDPYVSLNLIIGFYSPVTPFLQTVLFLI
jgi:hypothetical protein